MTVLDWGEGHYETTAKQLFPVAEHALRELKLDAGERVLDLGCGTGNAALLAAETGAQVIAVDPSPSLLARARSRAMLADQTITFREGKGSAIPVADGDVSAVVSIFAAIFDPNPVATLQEILRVLAAGGRFVLTSWCAGGVFQELAEGAPGYRTHTSPWASEEGIRELAAGSGAILEITRHTLAFESDDSHQWFDDLAQNHPFWRAIRREHTDLWPRYRGFALEVLEKHNDAKKGFCVHSDYFLIQGHRRPQADTP